MLHPLAWASPVVIYISCGSIGLIAIYDTPITGKPSVFVDHVLPPSGELHKPPPGEPIHISTIVLPKSNIDDYYLNYQEYKVFTQAVDDKEILLDETLINYSVVAGDYLGKIASSSCPETVRFVCFPKKSFEKSILFISFFGILFKSRFVTWNISPAPSASAPVIIGV